MYHIVRFDGHYSCTCEYYEAKGWRREDCNHIKIVTGSQVSHLLPAKRRYNHLCARFRAKRDKVMSINIGRLKTIEGLYSDLELLKDKIVTQKSILERLRHLRAE